MMRRGSRRRRIATVVGAVVVLFFVVVLVDSALYNHKIHAGVTIAGYRVSGLTQAGATAKLQKLVDDAAGNQIVLTSGSMTWPVMPDELGTKIDVAATVSAAMAESRRGGFFGGIVHRLSLYFNHKDLPMQGSVDATRMDGFIASVAGGLDIPAVNAAFAIDGEKITVIDAKNGRVVDRDALKRELTNLLLTLQATELVVPMKDDIPKITAESSQETIAQAKTMIGAPITVTYQDKSWTLSPATSPSTWISLPKSRAARRCSSHFSPAASSSVSSTRSPPRSTSRARTPHGPPTASMRRWCRERGHQTR